MTGAVRRGLPDLQPLFDAFVSDRKAPGLAFAVIRGGEILATGGAGTVEPGQDRTPTGDSVFRIASMTKSFTAAAVLQLRDAGALALDDPVAKYVPEMAGLHGATADSPEIAIRHLLTMTAGFPTDDPWGDRQQSLPLDRFRAFLATHPEPVWAAGTHFEYANLGYATLGLVLAAVSGRPYRDLVAERLLAPLGMTATVFDAEAVPPAELVPGFVLRDDAWLAEPIDAYGAFAAMGGLFSSVRDLARWMAFFLDAFPPRDEPDAGQPLSRSSRREMQQLHRIYEPEVAMDGGRVTPTVAGYGLGLSVEHHPEVGRLVGHSGGYPGYGSHMRWHPDTGLGVVVLANARYAPVWDVTRQALVRVVRASGEPVVRPVKPSAATLAARASVEALLTGWDDAVAASIFAPNVVLDEPLEHRRSQLEDLTVKLGELAPDTRREPQSESPSHVAWWLRGERGHAKAEIQMSPERPPRIQSLSVVATDGPVFELRHETLRMPLRDPFRIARTHADRLVTVVATSLTHRSVPGVEGLGEAYPDAYYGETAETIGAVLPLLLEAVRALGEPPGTLDAGRAWLADASEAMEGAIRHHGGAKAGMDIALHDFLGKRLGIPLWELLGTSPEIPPTDFSIGMDEPAVVAQRAARAARFPALKIKVGGEADIETLEAVRAVYTGPIRVDANTGWQPEQGARLIPELVRLGVELVEQPFPAHQIRQLGWLQERSSLPIVTDESSVTIDDLDGLVGVVAGVNVKLAKCGGVGPALRMLRRARELGFKTMLGCMEETSISIAAGAAIASLADWVDLDGNLLLAADPFEGLELGADCRWRLGREPGLGVRRREA